jgi:hypothetical protein
LDGEPRFASGRRPLPKIIINAVGNFGHLNKTDMSLTIKVDRQYLYYSDGTHDLTLAVEWSGVSKTEDCPIDFEISAANLETWDGGKPISPVHREQVLDNIANYYSTGPIADIIGKNGEMLRGASKFRFSLQIHPMPSRYHGVGRRLMIPMMPTHRVKKWNEKYILDFSGINEWTTPKTPLRPEYLNLIAERIVRTQRVGVIGVTAP